MLLETVVAFIIGVICIVIGVFNTKGHISMLHSYHRKRVSEENRLPFGKLVGAGMMTLGGSICISSVFTAVAEYKNIAALNIAGIVIISVGLFAGIGICFYAMIKYNKGIF